MIKTINVIICIELSKKQEFVLTEVSNGKYYALDHPRHMIPGGGIIFHFLRDEQYFGNASSKHI